MGSPTSNPRVNIQLSQANIVTAFKDRTNLIVGQKGATGTAVSGDLIQDVEFLRDDEIKILLGTGELYHRVAAWRDGVEISDGGILPSLDVIPVDESGTGVAATATAVVAGTSATADGELTVSVIDEKQFSVNVNVTSGDTPTVVAAAIDAAFNLLTDKPFTNGAAVGTVTFTASDVGTVGNYYGVKIEGNIAGLTLSTTAWASGANDPILTTILDSIEGIRYTGLSWPEYWQDSLSIPVDEFDSRFNVSNGIMDGVVVHGRSETFANAISAVAALNSQSLVMMGNNVLATTLQNGPAILIPADWVVSLFMGIKAKRLTTGTQIADLIVAQNALRDSTGGAALASLAYFNTPLKNAPVTSPTYLYSKSEQKELESVGFTTYGVNTAKNGMLMAQTVTTRTTDAAGNENDSFLYLNYVDTGSVCREIFFFELKAAYAQSRLTQGDLVAGRSMENPASIKQELMSIYRDLADLVLVQAGSDAEAFFSDNTTVEITGGSLVNRGVTINGVLPIVTQLGTIDYNLALSFDVGA